MTNQQGAPEALRHADGLESFARMLPAYGFDPQPLKDAAATVRSLHALALELADQLSGKNERLAALVEAQQPATHVQNPAEIEHVAGDVSKNRAESNMKQQPATDENLRQILTDSENQPNQYGVQFLMHGAKMAFRIGNRQFCLDYEPDEPGEFEFMRDALISAFSTFTPDVKMAQQPAHKAPQQAAPSTDQVEEILRERDDAEDFIDALLDEVLGHERPEWSSAYGRADALNDVRERMTALHKPAVDKAWGQFQSAMEAPQQPAPSAAAYAELPYALTRMDQGAHIERWRVVDMMEDYADATHVLRTQQPAQSAAAAQQSAACDKAPAGWLCIRQHGHDGPCAAEPTLSARSDEWVEGYAAGVRDGRKDALRTQQPAPAIPDTEAFQNFHRLLCARFGYVHDERDWRRDQLSLVEHIARQAQPSPTPQADSAPATSDLITIRKPTTRAEVEWLVKLAHLLVGDVNEQLQRVLDGADVPQADSQPAPGLDIAVMQLAESVGLIGPASRVGDLHAAIQRFHDLICVNATIKAAVMAADAIRGAARAPADSVTAPAGAEVAYLDIGAGGYIDLGTDLSNEALSRLPKGRHALVIAGTYGIDGYTPTQPAQAADSVLEDAARWQELRAQHEDDAAERCCVFAPNDMRECLVPVGSLPGELDAFIDAKIAARKQGANHD